MAIIMLFFSAVGFSGFVVMFLFLQPWTAKDEKEIRDKMKVAKRTEPTARQKSSHVPERHPCTSPAPRCGGNNAGGSTP
eukprot:gene13547-biopygen81